MARKNSWNTNLASEFHVMSVLHRLGFDANLTLGNKKAVDIAVVRDAGDAVTIDVKAVVGKTGWLVGSASGPARPRHFVILLTYQGSFSDVTTVPRAWVLPHAEFLLLVKQAKAPSTMRYISRKSVLQLNDREERWELLKSHPFSTKERPKRRSRSRGVARTEG